MVYKPAVLLTNKRQQIMHSNYLKIKLSYALATGLGSGLVPKAPGTAGSLVYFLIFLLLCNFFGELSLSLRLFSAGLVCLMGFWSVAHQLKSDTQLNKDPQQFVIDEWAGLAIAFASLPTGQPNFYWQVTMLFVLFRFFDIVKPWPIRLLERLPGAWGIMLDDMLAGLFAALVVFLSNYSIQLLSG